MSFRKYQSAEKVEIEERDESERIRSEVTRLGKISAVELTDEERSVLNKNLHS